MQIIGINKRIDDDRVLGYIALISPVEMAELCGGLSPAKGATVNMQTGVITAPPPEPEKLDG